MRHVLPDPVAPRWFLERSSVRETTAETTRKLELVRQAGKVIRIGRTVLSDLCLVSKLSKRISREHATITCQKDGSFVLIDTESSNGLLLNNIRVSSGSPSILKAGDTIAFGAPKLVNPGDYVDPSKLIAHEFVYVVKIEPDEYSHRLQLAKDSSCKSTSQVHHSAVSSQQKTSSMKSFPSLEEESKDQAPANLSPNQCSDMMRLGLLVELENLLECQICLQTLQKPVVLRCGHSFCENCWKGWGQKTFETKKSKLGQKRKIERKVECPNCRLNVELSDGRGSIVLKGVIEAVSHHLSALSSSTELLSALNQKPEKMPKLNTEETSRSENINEQKLQLGSSSFDHASTGLKLGVPSKLNGNTDHRNNHSNAEAVVQKADEISVVPQDCKLPTKPNDTSIVEEIQPGQSSLETSSSSLAHSSPTMPNTSRRVDEPTPVAESRSKRRRISDIEEFKSASSTPNGQLLFLTLTKSSPSDSFGMGIKSASSKKECPFLVFKTVPNSIAEKAGVLEGDFIVFGSGKVPDGSDISSLTFSNLNACQTLELQIFRSSLKKESSIRASGTVATQKRAAEQDASDGTSYVDLTG